MQEINFRKNSYLANEMWELKVEIKEDAGKIHNKF